jgi:hypothetical protein
VFNENEVVGTRLYVIQTDGAPDPAFEGRVRPRRRNALRLGVGELNP